MGVFEKPQIGLKLKKNKGMIKSGYVAYIVILYIQIKNVHFNNPDVSLIPTISFLTKPYYQA